MAEKHIPRHDHEQHHGVEHHKEHHERIRAHHESAAEKARAEKSQENLEKIRAAAKTEAVESHKLKHEQPAHGESSDSVVGNQYDLKKTAYARSLKKIQQRLPGPARSFSKFVHNPVVDTVSAVGASTVGRPSGMLGGSIFAFLGSLGLLYYSKHYGFQYNYLFLFILFVGGFALGGLVELIVWLVFKRRRNY